MRMLCPIVFVAAYSAAAQSFPTAAQAAEEFVRASEANDVPALERLFGPGSKDLIESGDAVQDRNQRAAFARNARVALKLQPDPDNPNRMLLLTGDDQDPFAVPLVRNAGGWQFDTAAGRAELLARRVGANELDAIAFASNYVQAQNTYATGDLDANGMAQYAQKFVSTPGARDGLYWPAKPGGPVSPISIAMMRAAAEGYPNPNDEPAAYHGYLYRILKSQGSNAPGGARDYLAQGLMIGGFAMVAWPGGVRRLRRQDLSRQPGRHIYEKDLGPKDCGRSPVDERV